MIKTIRNWFLARVASDTKVILKLISQAQTDKAMAKKTPKRQKKTVHQKQIGNTRDWVKNTPNNVKCCIVTVVTLSAVKIYRINII